MGRSLSLPQASPPIEDFAPAKATVKHPVTGAEYRAYIDAEGRFWQEERFPGRPGARRVEASWVIGSGNHTRSYLGLVEGEVVELPLTWYARRGIWDMSPGYEGRGHFRFGRTVKPECAFCHNDLVAVAPGTYAGYQLPLPLGIGCARCHGDTRAHVEARMKGQRPPAGASDPTILNPARLPIPRQLDLCSQCHLQGEARVLLAGQRWDAYDPSTPLADFMSIYVPAGERGETFGIASHGDRLSQSACAKVSGRLTCTTCHNPHKPPTPEAFRAACLSCHKPADCGDAHGKAKNAQCFECHMRKGGTSDIPHVQFTDHWIRKRPTGSGGPARARAALPPNAVLIDALAKSRTVDDKQAALREGIAHHDVWRFQGRDAHQPFASELLEGATRTTRDRADAFFALARTRQAQGDRQGAASAYAEATRLEPSNSVYLVDQAENLEGLGDLKGAEAVLRRALEARPDYRVAVGNLANNLVRQSRMPEAETLFDRAEKLSPTDAMTPQNRGFALLSLRRYGEAEKLLNEASLRDPLNPQPLFGLGMMHAAQGKLDLARTPLDAAVLIDPLFGPARFLRGQIRAAAGDLPGAREDYTRWTAAEPKNTTAFLELAKVCAAMGDRKAALDALTAGDRIAPGDPTLQALRGELVRGGPGAPPKPGRP